MTLRGSIKVLVLVPALLLLVGCGQADSQPEVTVGGPAPTDGASNDACAPAEPFAARLVGDPAFDEAGTGVAEDPDVSDSTLVELGRSEVVTAAEAAETLAKFDGDSSRVDALPPDGEVAFCIYYGAFGPARGPQGAEPRPGYDATRLLVLPDGGVTVHSVGYAGGLTGLLPSDSPEQYEEASHYLDTNRTGAE